MREEKLSLEDLANIVVEANQGTKRTVFMVWFPYGKPTITTIWLLPDELWGVMHNWKHSGAKVYIDKCFEDQHALFDNYWMAYRHSLLAMRDPR